MAKKEFQKSVDLGPELGPRLEKLRILIGDRAIGPTALIRSAVRMLLDCPPEDVIKRLYAERLEAATSRLEQAAAAVQEAAAAERKTPRRRAE